MVNVMQQLGGSLGLAVLVAVFGTASRDCAGAPGGGPVRGGVPRTTSWRTACPPRSCWRRIFDVAALLVIATLLRDAAPRGARRSPAELADEQVRASRGAVPD